MSDECEANRQLVLTFLDLLGRGDVDGAFELTAPELGWFSPSSRAFTAREAMRSNIVWVFENLLTEPIRQDVEFTTAEENRVAVVSEGHAMTKNGEDYNNLYHFLFQVDSGLITKIWEYNNPVIVTQVLLKGARLPT